jgi:hypothetical protein
MLRRGDPPGERGSGGMAKTAIVRSSGVPGRKSITLLPGCGICTSPPSWQAMQALSASQWGSVAGLTIAVSVSLLRGSALRCSSTCNWPGRGSFHRRPQVPKRRILIHTVSSWKRATPAAVAGKALRQNRTAKTVVCEFEAWRKLPPLELGVVREWRLKEVLPSADDVTQSILASPDYVVDSLCIPNPA